MNTGYIKNVGAMAGLALALVCSATAQPARPDRGRDPDRRAPQPVPGRQERMQRLNRAQFAPPGVMRAFAILTPEQRASIRELMQGQQEKSRSMGEKLEKARQQLMDTALEKEFNEQAVRKHARAITELETERMLMMAKALSKVDPPLTPEQRRELREPLPMREGMGRFGPPNQPPGPDREGAPFRDRFRERQNRDRGPRDRE